VSSKKQRREIDKAIRHLMAYSTSAEQWCPRFEQFHTETLISIVENSGYSEEEIEFAIFDGEYAHMGFGHMFEAFATCHWDAETTSMIDDYLARRGWREAPAGRRYLQALNDSESKIWEVTEVKPGAWVRVREYGTTMKPVRVHEVAASKSLRQWDFLLARVLRINSKRTFSGALLPLNLFQVEEAQSRFDAIPDNIRAFWRDEENHGLSPEEIEESVQDELVGAIADIAFDIWASSVAGTIYDHSPLPDLKNTDHEQLLLTRTRFPLNGDQDTVIKALTGSVNIEGNLQQGWFWYQSSDDSEVLASQTVLGRIELKDDKLILETNSAERTERGSALLRSLLGDALGTALSVHETPEQAFDFDREYSKPQNDLNDLPEVQHMLQEYLTTHYRQTLDEPLPMLGGATPRACVADPERRAEVITWLKYLENSHANSPQQPYDFSWIWQELGLSRDAES